MNPTIQPVPGHDGYFADTGGGIWSARGGGLRQLATYRIKTRAGYVRWIATLGRRQTKNGNVIGFNVPVGRAVLLAWVGPPPLGRPMACHVNDVTSDNRLENLYWGSGLDNVADAKRNGRMERCSGEGHWTRAEVNVGRLAGERHPGSAGPSAARVEAVEGFRNGESARVVGADYGIAVATVYGWERTLERLGLVSHRPRSRRNGGLRKYGKGLV